MNKKKIKSTIALLIISVLILSAFAIIVSANDAEDTTSEVQEESIGDIFDIIIEAFGFVFSTAAFVFSIISLGRSRSETVRMYYEEIEKPEYYKARHILYIYRDIKIRCNLEHSVESSSDFWKELQEKQFDDNGRPCSDLWGKLEKWDLPKKDEYSVATDKNFEKVKNAASIMANFYQKWGFLQQKKYLPLWVFKSSAGYNLIRLYLAVEDFVEDEKKTNPYYAVEFQKLCKRVYKKYGKVIKECSENEKKHLGYSNGNRDAFEWNPKKKGGMKKSGVTVKAPETIVEASDAIVEAAKAEETKPVGSAIIE